MFLKETTSLKTPEVGGTFYMVEGTSLESMSDLPPFVRAALNFSGRSNVNNTFAQVQANYVRLYGRPCQDELPQNIEVNQTQIT